MYKPFRPFRRGPTTLLTVDLRLPWLLTTYVRPGMILLVMTTLRITGPCYRGVWMCIAGVWDLQTTSFEIP